MVLDKPIPYSEWKKQQEVERDNSHGKAYKVRKYQKESLLTAHRNNEPIEDWEMEYFLGNVKQEDGEDFKLLLGIAVHLERTFNAMVWWFNNAYCSKKFEGKQHHAQAIMKRFGEMKEKMYGSK
jgi:hypothetical protein